MRSPEHEAVVKTLKALSERYKTDNALVSREVRTDMDFFFSGSSNGDLFAIKTLARNWRNRNKKGV